MKIANRSSSGDPADRYSFFPEGRLWPEITRSSGCRRMATMSGSSQEPVDRGGLLGKRGTRRPEPTGAPRRSDRRPRAAGTRWVAGWRPGEGSKQGGQRRLRQPPTGRTAGPAPTLADRWRPKPTRSAFPPVGAARHSLVLLGFVRRSEEHTSE